MGALHVGHLSLVDVARQRADRVVVSIFVNPTQFNDPSDFEGYPRVMEADLEACRAAGVDVVWTPTAEELYPEGAATSVDVAGLTEPLCGSNRPGHFQGVTTVVTKLFLAAKAPRGRIRREGFSTARRHSPNVRRFGFRHRDPRRAYGSRARWIGFVQSQRPGLDPKRESNRSKFQSRLGLSSLCSRPASVHDRLSSKLAKKKLAEATLAKIDYAELRDPESLELAPEILAGPVLFAVALQFGGG